MTVLGDRATKEVIRLNEVIKVELYSHIIDVLIRRGRDTRYTHRGKAM